MANIFNLQDKKLPIDHPTPVFLKIIANRVGVVLLVVLLNFMLLGLYVAYVKFPTITVCILLLLGVIMGCIGAFFYKKHKKASNHSARSKKPFLSGGIEQIKKNIPPAPLFSRAASTALHFTSPNILASNNTLNSYFTELISCASLLERFLFKRTKSKIKIHTFLLTNDLSTSYKITHLDKDKRLLKKQPFSLSRVNLSKADIILFKKFLDMSNNYIRISPDSSPIKFDKIEVEDLSNSNFIFKIKPSIGKSDTTLGITWIKSEDKNAFPNNLTKNFSKELNIYNFALCSFLIELYRVSSMQEPDIKSTMYMEDYFNDQEETYNSLVVIED